MQRPTPQTTADQIAIVNSTDNQASLQTIMDNVENTMTEEASMSVGSVLIRLAKHHLEFHVDAQGQMHLNENKLNQYLADLKQKIETHISKHETELALEKEQIEKAKENEFPTHSSQTSPSDSANQAKNKKIDYGFLKAAWNYMQDRMQEAPNGLDQVIFFEDDKRITVVINIQTTLALVYAAITDTDIFKPDSKDFEKNQQERFYSLIMSFKRLQFDSKQRCHQGVRHDLVICNLSGTYPDAMIVSEPKCFLADLISEAIFKLVEKIKIEFGQDIYLDVIKECLMGEVHPELKKQLGDKSELRTAIHKAFRYVGLDPSNQKYEIEKYIRALNVVVTLPEGLMALGQQVHTLLQSNTKQSNELKSRVQFIEFMKTDWLKNSFSLANSEHQDTISILSQVETAYGLCQKYGKLFKSSNVNPKLSIEAFDSIYKQIDDYYQSALSKQAPIKATDVFLNQLEKLKTALAPLAKEMEWTSNIFAKWRAALTRCEGEEISDNALDGLIQLHQEITDPDIQSHYLVTDEFLKEIFKPTDENTENQFDLSENNSGLVFKHTQTQKIDLDYFNINRLFLSGIVTSPKDWTPLFFEKIKETLQFLINEFDPGYASLMSQNSKAFVRDSYPENLITQLYQASNQYKIIHKLELDQLDIELEIQAERKGLYIPVLHQVKDFNSLMYYFRLLPESKHEEFVQYLKDQDICQSGDAEKIEREMKAFNKSFKKMSSAQREIQLLKILLSIHSNYLIATLNNDISNLIDVLGNIKEELKFPILNHVGVEYIKALAAEKIFALAHPLFKAFSENSRIDLLNFLGMDFIKDWASDDSIAYFIEIFPENQRLDILKLFGIDFFKKNKSYRLFPRIPELFEAFSEESRIDLLNFLGMDFIKKITPHNKISDLIGLFPENQKLDILKLFGIECLKDACLKSGFGFLNPLFESFEISNRIHLFEYLDFNFIESAIYYLDIPNLLNHFPVSQRLEIFKEFKIEKIKEYYLNVKPHGLSHLMIVFGKDDKLEYPLEFLKYFGIDFIREFILKNDINFFYPIDSISEKNTFFKALGSHFLKEYFLKSNELSLIGFVDESERFPLLLMLGFDTVRQWILTYPEHTASLIYRIPLKLRENFLHALGFDFLRSLIANEKTAPSMDNLIDTLPHAARLDFLYELGLPFLKEQLTNQSMQSLEKLLQALPKEERINFLKWLDVNLLQLIAKKHPKGVISWLREISPHLTEEHTKEILILLGKDFLESQIKTSKDIEFLATFFKVRDTFSISTTYFGLFNRHQVQTPDFVLQDALFGSEQPAFPQPLSNPYGHGPNNYFICGNGWKDWVKLMDTWNEDEIQTQDQYQWFAAYPGGAIAGLILIRYADGDYGLMLGARKGSEESLSKAFKKKFKSAEDQYLQHFKEWRLHPPFYMSKGLLHEMRAELSDIFDVITHLEGKYPADRLLDEILSQFDKIKMLPGKSY